MDFLRDHTRRARTANCGDIEDRAILDCLDLGREFVLVTIFLKIAIELNRLDEAVSFRRYFIDGEIFCPAEMRIDALAVLGSECNFHASDSFSKIKQFQAAHGAL